MKFRIASKYTFFTIVCLQAISHGAEIPKLFNNTALNLGASWDLGAVPGPADVMLWNATHIQPWSGALPGPLPPLGADASVLGLKVTNVGGTPNNPTSYVGFRNDNSAFTLTLGAGGIDMSTATQTLIGMSKLTLGASQTWNIANANTNGNPTGYNYNEDLIFQAQAADSPFNLGGNTLTVQGAGTAVVGSGYALSNGHILYNGTGSLILACGNSRNTTIDGTVDIVVSSGTVRLHSYSSAAPSGTPGMVSAAPITLNGGTLLLSSSNETAGVSQTAKVTLNSGTTLTQELNAGTSSVNRIAGEVNIAGNSTWNITAGGGPTGGAQFTGNLTGTANLAFNNNNANSLGIFSGDNSAYAGTISLGGSAGNVIRLASATAGSAAATWNIATGKTLQVNGLDVQLGTLRGTGGVTNSSPTAPAILNVAKGSFAGTLSDGTAQKLGLNKIGPDTLTLSGSNTYSGATSVSAGTLQVTTNQTVPTSISVADGATFSPRMVIYDTNLNLDTGNLTVSGGGTLLLDYADNVTPTTSALLVNNLRFNGASTIRVSGKNLTAGTFPLVGFITLDPASTAIGALKLVLPTRTTGSITNSGTGIDLTIASTQQIRWSGDVSNVWDIDDSGTVPVEGTANWKTTVSNTSVPYFQGAGGSDVVNFGDNATGTGSVTVSLASSLSPVGVVFSNVTRDYIFTGAGKLTGNTSLNKTGAAALKLTNLSTYDYTGTTTITEGSLHLGDGSTIGGGLLNGNVSIGLGASLVLNHPDGDNFSFPGTLTGTLEGEGSIRKEHANTATLTAAQTTGMAISLNAGKLVFAGGGNLSGLISGAGQLEAAGGTLTLSGFDTANANTGTTIVSAGVLNLSRSSVNAIGGDLTITGNGTWTQVANQIPDTATVTVLGSANPANPSGVAETFANAVVNGTADNTQFNLYNNMSVTGIATITRGVLGINSGQGTAINVNQVVLNPAAGTFAGLRVAGSTGASVLNVGAGGIQASGGEVQVKINGNAFAGTLNLAGDVTTTGNFAFTNGTFGANNTNLDVVNLTGNRVFNIGAGTTTTVAPDLVGTGTLLKSGGGTLSLGASAATNIAGGTTVGAGTLLVNGSLAGGAVVVNAGAIFGGTGTVTPALTVNGTVAPGVAAAGNLTVNSQVTFAPGSILNVDVVNWAGIVPGTDWDRINASQLVLNATPANKLTIHVAGSPVGFTESAKTIVVASSTNAITGFDASAIQIDQTGFSGTGVWTVQMTGNNIELVYAAGAGGTAYATWSTSKGLDATNNGPIQDPDFDGIANALEFVLGGDPKVSEAGKMPVPTTDANNFIFTFNRADESEAEIGLTFQYGSDLVGWTDVAVGAAGAGQVAITENAAAPDTVVVTVPKAAGGKLFGRLKAVK